MVGAGHSFRTVFDAPTRADDVWFCTAVSLRRPFPSVCCSAPFLPRRGLRDASPPTPSTRHTPTQDCGWITGHTYVAYGPLLNGATQIVFEGVPSWPDAGRLWRIVDQHKVTHLYTAPTAIRALMRSGDDPVTATSRASLKLLGSVGEPINPEALWRRPFVLCSSSRRATLDPARRRRRAAPTPTRATAGVAVVPRGRGRRPLPRRAFRGVLFVFLSFFFTEPPARPRAPPADRAPTRRLDPAARRPTPRPHAGNRPRADPPGRARPARRAWPTASLLRSRRAGLPREKYPRDAIDAPKTQADTWWQTETGVIQIAPTMAAGAGPHKPGAAMTPVAGCVPALLDATTGAEIPAVIGEEAKGLLVLKQPWPSMARTCFAASFVLCSSSRPRARAAVAFRAGVASWRISTQVLGRPRAVRFRGVPFLPARWRYLTLGLLGGARVAGRDHRARRGLRFWTCRSTRGPSVSDNAIDAARRRRAGSRTRTSATTATT